LALAALFITRYSSAKTSLLLAGLLGFGAIWLLPTTIAFTVVFATKAAKISASIGGVSLPQAIIEAQEKAFGLTPVYKHKIYREPICLFWTNSSALTRSSPCRHHYSLVHIPLCRNFFCPDVPQLGQKH
jgi:hypothetical protein